MPLSVDQLDQKAVDAARKQNRASVNAVAEKIRNEENITLEEMRTILTEIVLRDRLDI